MTDFRVRRDSLETVEFADGVSDAAGQIGPGEALLRIDAFSFTANNISYATFGDFMSYWNFFPAEDGWGRIPVWGFADVVASECEGVEVGQRFYGYLPMSSYLVVTPGNVTASGFSDFAEHRKELHAVYNSYQLTSADPSYAAALEAEIMLLRPLFSTSFLIDDFFEQSDWFGAKAVVMSSASSKTAYGTAFMLARRDGVNVIGLTAAGNVEFVERLGLYDQVLSYDEIGQLDADIPIVYIDFSGDASVRAALHNHLGDSLVFDSAVGATHIDALGGADGLPGPAPVLFFAPAQAKKRSDDWGSDGLIERISGSLDDFIKLVADSENKLMVIEHGSGQEAVEQVYLGVLKGRASPDAGSILSLPA
ncbi:MAG: DUF2855 family protein [Solirubrobacterales bacterium]|nr:DUF2855 family protein [Solirubrobacterales bacterium]